MSPEKLLPQRTRGRRDSRPRSALCGESCLAMKPRPHVILLWLLALAACLGVVWQTRFTADMSAFLPQSPSRGAAGAGRADEGRRAVAPAAGRHRGRRRGGRAQLSKDLAARLRASARVRRGAERRSRGLDARPRDPVPPPLPAQPRGQRRALRRRRPARRHRRQHRPAGLAGRADDQAPACRATRPAN